MTPLSCRTATAYHSNNPAAGGRLCLTAGNEICPRLHAGT
ncbi:hypothetical protein M3J09_008159 [Ascochyta lentis]